MKNKQNLILFVSLLTFSLLFFTGINRVDASDKNQLFEDLEVFTDVLSVVQSDYVDQPESQKLVNGAIKGMLQALDPHSSYLDPEHFKELEANTRGEFGGLGIEISGRDGKIVVITPMPGSPAEKAGVRSGDTIIKIGDQFTQDFTLNDAVKLLRGKRGTPVTISVQREKYNSLIDIKIIRDRIKIDSVKKRYLGNGYGYIRINQFMDKTTSDVKASIKHIRKQSGGNINGLILDLRNNPGGLLTQAIKVSDLFIKEGVIVYTEGRLKSQKQRFYAKDSNDEPDYPLVVLINGGSASASEIVSGALQQTGRALLVGIQSFGKGSVQTVNPLSNGGALTLTTALYYLRNGISIQAEGIIPDIIVEQKDLPEPKLSKHKLERIREADLPKAIKNPTSQEAQETQELLMDQDLDLEMPEYKPIDPEKDSLEEWRGRDEQFNKGWELLSTFEQQMAELKRAATK